MKENYQKLGLSPNEMRAVIRLSSVARAKDLNYTINQSLLINETVNFRFLVALLVVAGDLASLLTISDVDYDEYSRYSETLNEPFGKGMSIVGIGYGLGERKDCIVIEAIAWKRLDLLFLQQIVSEIEDRHNAVAPILDSEGVHVRKIELIVDQTQIHETSTLSGLRFRRIGAPEKAIGSSIRIKKLTLTNIKCFKKISLSFDNHKIAEPWVLLVGDNAVGKSTILQCIALCSVGPNLAQKLLVDVQPESMIRVGNEEGYIEAVFETTNDSESMLNTVRLKLERKSKTIKLDLTESDAAYFMSQRENSTFKGWLVLGYGASRNLRYVDDPARIASKDLIIDRLESLFNPSKILIDPLAVVGFLNGDLSTFKDINPLSKLGENEQQIVREILENMLPDSSWLLRREDVGEVLGKERIDINQMSDGYKSMLSWLLHLIVHLYTSINWRGDIRELKGVVLIDEIDLHLHPKWQRTVIGSLRRSFPNLQFIATTHSPMTLGGLEQSKGNIIVLKPLGHGIQAIKKIPLVKGWRADQILTSILFDLPTTRDVGTAKLISDYTDLAVKDNLTTEEENALESLAEKLGIRLPSSEERQAARDAYGLVSDAIREKWEQKSPEEKELILREVKLRLQEIASHQEVPN